MAEHKQEDRMGKTHGIGHIHYRGSRDELNERLRARDDRITYLEQLLEKVRRPTLRDKVKHEIISQLGLTNAEINGVVAKAKARGGTHNAIETAVFNLLEKWEMRLGK